MVCPDVVFYPGLHQPSDAKHFDRCCISIKRLMKRRDPVICFKVFVDSGAFTELSIHGEYRHGVEVYARELYRLHMYGVVCIEVAVAQDYMCEPFITSKTGLTIADHQRLTIERYDALIEELKRLFKRDIPFHVMPVLQGFSVQDYIDHIRAYGDRLKPGMWVGVGSVCKRQGKPSVIVDILQAIHEEKPGLRLHGFGVKKTALVNHDVRRLISTADSMAWSFAARRLGRDPNDWREAAKFADDINAISARAA